MIDVESLRVSDEEAKTLLEAQRKKREKDRKARSKPKPRLRSSASKGRSFIRGPIDCQWAEAAVKLGGKSANLVLALWWQYGMKRQNAIPLTPSMLVRFDLTPQAARRLLGQFERAGLVEVDRKRGRSPIVTLVLPEPDDGGQPGEVKV